MAHATKPHRHTSAHLRLALALGAGVGLVYFGFASLLVSNEAKSLLTPALSARQAAEAGLNKALYCLNAATGNNCGGSADGQYRGETGRPFGDATFTTTLTGTGHERTIRSLGLVGGHERHVMSVAVTDLPLAAMLAIPTALHAGAGGIALGAKSTINGNVLSGGILTCAASNAVIVGMATVAGVTGRPGSCGIKSEDLNVATLTTAALPAFDLAPWQALAVAGSTKSGPWRPANGDRLGPLKVDGDLLIEAGVTVNLDGAIWVTGSLTLRRGAKLILNPAFGEFSTVIVANDRITVEPGASLLGSGKPASHVLLVTDLTDDKEPGVTVAGNPGEAIFLAPRALIKLADRAVIEAAAAYRLVVGQRVTVTHLPSDPPLAVAASPGGVWRLK